MTPARQFVFRLALASGYWTYNPDAMLARMPYRIWREWQTYAQIELFGEERADLRAGIVAATVANCLARRKGQPAFRVKDFMPSFDLPKRTAEAPTREALFAQVQMINQTFGGKTIVKQGEPPMVD